MSFTKIKQLYIAVNHVVAELGKDGKIDTRNALVSALNDALADIDNGEFKPVLFDKAQVKLETMATRITELEAQLADAKQVANDCRIVADNAIAEAQGALKDAARYREAIKYVGGKDGYFHLDSLRPLKGADIMRGSVSEHFSQAIDAAMQPKEQV